MTPSPSVKLPLWRLLAGIAVLGSLVGIVIALTPVYFDNFLLGRYVRDVAQSGFKTMPDENIRAGVVNRAKALDLPLKPADVQIAHPNGHLQIRTDYRMRMNLLLYQVDLHFHPEATSP